MFYSARSQAGAFFFPIKEPVFQTLRIIREHALLVLASQDEGKLQVYGKTYKMQRRAARSIAWRLVVMGSACGKSSLSIPKILKNWTALGLRLGNAVSFFFAPPLSGPGFC
ncbi:hypothetical protein KP509_11G078800 [Ceratopteris richardii]|uniref:Uncharacterized protein n=1 Tax=Ceratopteris richardii TaxID=49495 RepID=A0A8T2TWZ1_CERRI|nr:hypothetical protein KP509_11G078800 [Ceratopteris richardii]